MQEFSTQEFVAYSRNVRLTYFMYLDNLDNKPFILLDICLGPEGGVSVSLLYNSRRLVPSTSVILFG